MPVLFSSSSNLSLIRWIPQDSLICWHLIPPIFVLPTTFLSTFISFASNVCLFFFYVSSLVSSAYVKIGRTVALDTFYFISFLICFFLQTRSFKQPATIAAFWAWVLIYLVVSMSDHEVAGSIHGTSTNFKCGLGLERGPPTLVRAIG